MYTMIVLTFESVYNTLHCIIYRVGYLYRAYDMHHGSPTINVGIVSLGKKMLLLMYVRILLVNEHTA